VCSGQLRRSDETDLAVRLRAALERAGRFEHHETGHRAIRPLDPEDTLTTDRDQIMSSDEEVTTEARADEAERTGWRKYLAALGPGFITGCSDDDPSGIATYSQAGAKYGFGMLWAAFLTYPLGAATQEICDRTALATGKSLGELIAQRFSRVWSIVIGVLIVILCVANALNIAADLVAVGAGMHLLHAGPTTLWALLAGAIVILLLIVGSYRTISRAFRGFAVALLTYIAVLFVVHLDWRSVVAHTLVPHIQWSKGYLALMVAVLGTTLSPYLFFWQSINRVEDMRAENIGGRKAVPLRRRPDASKKLQTSRFDVFFGIGFSNLVMFAIIAATAATLGAKGHVDVGSADQAAEALRPVAGRFASTLFALGFIGSGMLAIPVLAGAGAAGLAGLTGKRAGFSNKIHEAPVFYGLVAAGTIGGMIFSMVGADPIKLLVFVAVINGVAAAPFLLIVMLVSGDRQIMGEYVNKRLATMLGWLTFAVMALAAITLVITGSGG
jgi:NRAMP (natural resistance-associated macrophage protein)-like metal ion transporter